MCEPAVLVQPLTGQDAVQADGDSGKGTPEVVVQLSPDELEGRRLRTELSQLRRAMATRPTIDQACGVLMASFGLSPEKAWHVLVTTSQNTNTKLHRLAGDLVGTVQGSPLPEPVQQQLVAAVAKAGTRPDPAA